MKYKRNDKAKNPDEPLIQKQWGHYKQINTFTDPGWIEKYLQELHEDGIFGLHQVQSSIDHVKTLDVKDYRLEIQKQKKEEPIIQTKKSLLTFLKKHLDRAEYGSAKYTVRPVLVSILSHYGAL